VGTNKGFAYIEPDMRCPTLSYGIKWEVIKWKKGDNDQPLNGVEQHYGGCEEFFDEKGTETGAVRQFFFRFYFLKHC